MSKKPAETAYIHQSRDVIVSEFIMTWPEISIRWYCLTPISILIAKKNFHFISSNWGERNTFLSSLEVCLKYDVVNQIKNLELKNKNEQIYFKILDARLSFVEIARVSFFCRAAEVVSSSNHAKKKKLFSICCKVVIGDDQPLMSNISLSCFISETVMLLTCTLLHKEQIDRKTILKILLFPSILNFLTFY